MKWVAALLTLGLLGAAVFYFLAVRNRTFQSYVGAEVGMQLETALSHLESNGYLIVHGPPKIRERDCSGDDQHTLVYAADPTYSLTISPDQNCKISEIARKLRGIEL